MQLTPAQRERQAHVAWVADVLKRMQTIKVGMTRADLEKVFTTEGGIFSRLQRTYVSRDCPYFKVAVQFEARGSEGQSHGAPGDVIVSISRPYLQFMTLD